MSKLMKRVIATFLVAAALVGGSKAVYDLSTKDTNLASEDTKSDEVAFGYHFRHYL